MYYRYLKKVFSAMGWVTLVIVLLRIFVFDPGVVSGRSMEKTFVNGETFFVNKLVYFFREPKRGDVVQARGKNAEDVLIKRVVGVPGDRLAIHSGNVYLLDANNQEHILPESYLKEDGKTFMLDDKPFLTRPIPEHFYFLLGDNRQMSIDSREVGLFHRTEIYGLVTAFSK